MNVYIRKFCAVLAAALIALPILAPGHQAGDGSNSSDLIVTRHFTGIWDQVEHEAQGIALQVVEQWDDSRRAVAYWFTYGEDRRSAWFIGIGDLVENRIELELFESTDVGFLQPAMVGNDSVSPIGTMTVTFSSCQTGEVSYSTTTDAIGSGSFPIERILEVMNTHCTGGIADDMHADAIHGEQRLVLSPARAGLDARGHARYEDYPAHMEFDVEVEGLSDGSYGLFVGGQERGRISVTDGRGEIRFSSPGQDGRVLMTFDPRGMGLEIHDGEGVVLSSFDRQFDSNDHAHQGGYGDGHAYACNRGGMGGHMGGGMRDCVEDGDFVEIEAELQNTGPLPDAEGEAEWEMNAERIRFSVQIENVPTGRYGLRVDGQDVGTIETVTMHDGENYGRITFRDPAVSGREYLDFEPRGALIEVANGDDVILQVEFPLE